MITKEKMAGLGFVEVLVSLLVIAMGAVGMAALHSRSLQYNQVAYHHSQAVVLAADMLDRLRINRAQALTTSVYQVREVDKVPASCTHEFYPDSCESGQCSSEQLAAYDIRQWKFYLLCQLPGASGAVSYEDDAGGRVYTVTVSFEDSSGALKPADLILRSTL